MTKHYYHGWTVTLMAHVERDLWWCRYAITKPGNTPIDGLSIDLYPSREDAESEAFGKAQALIDSYERTPSIDRCEASDVDSTLEEIRERVGQYGA